MSGMMIVARDREYPCSGWMPDGMNDTNSFWSMRYREGRPPSRAMFASDGKRVLLLAHIGPSFDYLCQEGHAEMHLNGIEPGVWIFEGDVNGDWFWTDIGYEHDEELRGEHRPLTDEEWELYEENEEPWESSLWGEPWPENPGPHTWEDGSAFCSGCGKVR